MIVNKKQLLNIEKQKIERTEEKKNNKDLHRKLSFRNSCRKKKCLRTLSMFQSSNQIKDIPSSIMRTFPKRGQVEFD